MAPAALESSRYQRARSALAASASGGPPVAVSSAQQNIRLNRRLSQEESSGHPIFLSGINCLVKSGLEVLLGRLKSLQTGKRGRGAGGHQARLAESIGVSPSTVAGWIAEENLPSADKLDGIARFFGLTASQLFDEHADSRIGLPPIAADLSRHTRTESSGLSDKPEGDDAVEIGVLEQRAARDRAFAAEIQDAIRRLGHIAVALEEEARPVAPSTPGSRRGASKTG